MGMSPHQSCRRTDLLFVTILLLVAIGIHSWQIHRTAVIARDGVGFMRYAWQLESQPWGEVLRANPHPPGYPLMIHIVSIPVRYFAGGIESEIMQASAQWANALAGILLVIPMYLLGRTLFDRRVGFGAAFLFQCLPVASRAMADALTEGTYLLFLVTALLFAVDAVKHRSVIRFGLCGVFGSLAYLTRPEGALVVVAASIVMLAIQILPAMRWPWRRMLACGTALAIASLAVAAPYMLIIGHVTNKTTGRNILQSAHQGMTPKDAAPTTVCASMPLAVFGPESREMSTVRRHLWCLGAIAEEVVKGYHYVAWLPAIAGLWWFRNCWRKSTESWVLLVLMLLNVTVLWRVAYVEAYVAERHSLTLVMCSIVWAVATIFAVSDKLATASRHFAPQRVRLASSTLWATILLTMLVVSGLPKSLAPLHTNRTGFHAAGVWLAQNAGPDSYIMDPFSWVEFYSGQVMRLVHDPAATQKRESVFVVLGGTKNEHERLPLIPEAKSWAQHGRVVFHWPDRPIQLKAEEVIVYQVP